MPSPRRLPPRRALAALALAVGVAGCGPPMTSEPVRPVVLGEATDGASSEADGAAPVRPPRPVPAGPSAGATSTGRPGGDDG